MRIKPLYILLSFIIVSCHSPNENLSKHDQSISEEILSKPMFNKNDGYVIAHYMTKQLPFDNGGQKFFFEKNWYIRDGWGKAGGGYLRCFPIYGYYWKGRTHEEHVLFEIEMAKKLGIDGFHFYFPGCGSNTTDMANYNRAIKKYIEVIKDHDLNFKITLSICDLDHQPGQTTEVRVKRVGERINELLDYKDSRDHKMWLRTPDGRLIFYTFNPKGLSVEAVQALEEGNKREQYRFLAKAFAGLGEEVGEGLAVMLLSENFEQYFSSPSLRDKYKTYTEKITEYQREINLILDYFPGITNFFNAMDQHGIDSYLYLNETCNKRNRTYIPAVHPDYYVFRHGRRTIWDNKKKLDEKADTNVAGLITHNYTPCRLSHAFRNQWELAIEFNSPSINVTTWNDLSEVHNMCPDVNKNFGYAILNKYYKRLWKTGNKIPEIESAIVFFKKYPYDADINPYKYQIFYPTWHLRKSLAQQFWEYESTQTEIVTLLKEPAELFVYGKSIGEVEEGLVASRVPAQLGPVPVEVKRDEKTIISFTTPEWRTDTPYRTDRQTYSYSSDFKYYYDDIFGSLSNDNVYHTAREYFK